MDPRGFPTTLPEFQRVFPDDRACATYLERLRWPETFACPKCSAVGEPYRFTARPGVLRCRACKADASLTAGTVMQSTHQPLSIWFWGAYLVTTQTPGQSALQFQRQLGLSRYETAWQILHKLRAGMVRPHRDTIGGDHAVEVDECLVGGKTRGEGRGVHHKAIVLGAVEARLRKPGEKPAAEGGAHHGTSQQHLQAYLNEFTFRFNRRFYPMTAFNSVLGIAARTVPPTYEALYSGAWEHPASQPRSPQIELPFT